MIGILAIYSSAHRIIFDPPRDSYRGTLNKVNCRGNSVVDVHLTTRSKDETFHSVGLDCSLFQSLTEHLNQDVVVFVYGDTIDQVELELGETVFFSGPKQYVVSGVIGGFLWIGLGIGMYSVACHRFGWIPSFARLREWLLKGYEEDR